MTNEAPRTPERKEILDDNARKFITEAIDPQFLAAHDATSFRLVVDWVETGTDGEMKVVRKQFENGTVQLLLVAKVTKDGNRTAEKREITEEEYEKWLASPTLHLEKTRYEFEYTQGDVPFSMKYDMLAGGKCMLEVDAADEAKRATFDPTDFSVGLEEVTGDENYYGYRVVSTVSS